MRLRLERHNQLLLCNLSTILLDSANPNRHHTFQGEFCWLKKLINMINIYLISFLRSKGLPIYEKLANDLDVIANEDEDPSRYVISALSSLLAVNARGQCYLSDITQTKLDFVASLALGERIVEIPGRFITLETSAKPDPVKLPELRMSADYATTACKHECAVLKQTRHVRQAHAMCTESSMAQRALMLSRAGQCGLDHTNVSLDVVETMATMDRPERYAHLDISESMLYSASTLHLYGLPFDYDALRSVDHQDACPVCHTALTDPLRPENLRARLFSWQTHMGRCGGDERCNQAHEMVKLVVKQLALCNPDPGGIAIPPSQLILEVKHLRSDASRPGDQYAIVGGLHAKDVAMDVLI